MDENIESDEFDEYNEFGSPIIDHPYLREAALMEDSDDSIDSIGSIGSLGSFGPLSPTEATKMVETHKFSYIPPPNKKAVEHKMSDLVNELKKTNLTKLERAYFQGELNVLKQQLSWYRGYSDPNYFHVTAPGKAFEEKIKKEEPNIPQRRYNRLKKEAIAHDLVNYYRYNNAMTKRKRKIILMMIEAMTNLSEAFGRYSSKTSFTAKSPDGIIVVNFDDLEYLKETVKKLTEGYSYMYNAKGMRSPYKSSVPYNFSGMHRRLFLKPETIEWIDQEAKFEELRKMMESDDSDWEDTYVYKGLITLNGLQTLIRLALLNQKSTYIDDAGKKKTHYKYTPDMEKYLKVTGYINNLGIRSFARSVSSTTPLPGKKIWLENYNLYPDIFDEFLNEMAIIQEYADVKYEEKRLDNSKK